MLLHMLKQIFIMTNIQNNLQCLAMVLNEKTVVRTLKNSTEFKKYYGDAQLFI